MGKSDALLGVDSQKKCSIIVLMKKERPTKILRGVDRERKSIIVLGEGGKR